MIKKICLLVFMIQIFLISGLMGGISQVNAQNLSQEMTDEEFLKVDDKLINSFLDDMIQIFLMGEIMSGITQVNAQNLLQEITDEEFLEVDNELINSFLDEMITKLIILEEESDQKKAKFRFASK